MDNCSDYETRLICAKACKYLLEGYLYFYDDFVASKRVIHLMNHGRTERIRKKNWNRYYSEWRLFVKRSFRK